MLKDPIQTCASHNNYLESSQSEPQLKVLERRCRAILKASFQQGRPNPNI